MRILVTGREGQVARALTERSGEGLVIEAIGRPDLDITDRASIERVIDEFKPDVLVNAAAYTAVDRAESETDAAFAVNRDGAENAAAAAAAAGLPIIQISTDYVFPGDQDAPYRESDATGPRSAYGLSKLAGEEAVAAANPAHAILRTAWVYSPWGNNFLKTMLRLAQDRDVVRVVADQHGAPTFAPDIAEGILLVARRMLAEPDAADWRGVFHMTAGGQTHWADFAQAIFRASAKRGGPSARVEPITTADYPTPARRPGNSVLDCSKFGKTFEGPLPAWEASIGPCIEALGQRTAERA